MKKMLIRSTLLVMAFFMVACSTGNKEKKEEILYLIQSNTGTVSGSVEKGYKLTMTEPQSHALWFADRSARKAGHIKIENVLKIWAEGDDSFKKDPPNAVMILGNNEPIAIELILESWNGSKVVFKIQSIEDKQSLKAMGGPVTLYIDDFPEPFVAAQ